jgi:superfamily II DNA or RNA helicase
MYRSPSRRYTAAALECWFARLVPGWENAFAEAELQAGRRLYRLARVTSTELLEDCAIVSFRHAGEDLYTVLEWIDGQPRVRISSDTLPLPRSLGVAALYEIEELLADALPAVPGDDLAPAAAVPAAALPAAPRTPVAPPVLPAPAPPAPPARLLQVRLEAAAQGVLLRAFRHGDGGRLLPVPGDGRLSDADREQMIRLTIMLHRAGFVVRPKARGYLLADAQRISALLGAGLARWCRHFDLQLDPRLDAWRSGVRAVSATVQLDRAGTAAACHWQAQVDGQSLAEEWMAAMLRQPEAVHLLPGVGMLRFEPASARAIRGWKDLGAGATDTVVPYYLLFSLFHEAGLQVAMSPEIAAWRAELESLPAPGWDLPACLRPYQVTGVTWLYRLLHGGCGALLADEMGLGKTLQTLSLVAGARILEKGDVLIVCPASVVPVWQDEIRRHFPAMPTRVLSGRQPLPSVPGGEVWLASYSQLRRHRAALSGRPFACAVLDEAQFIKNPDAKVTHACLAIEAGWRIALTGTPVENRHLDLWTIFRFLMPGLLGSRGRLADELRADPAALARRLRTQVAPFVLRRTKDRVAADLPEKVEITLPCRLTPLQEQEYRRLVAAGLRALDGAGSARPPERRMHVLALLTRLRQACCDPALLPGLGHLHLRHSGKLASLEAHLAEVVGNGSKVVLFSQFTTFLDRADRLLAGAFPELPRFHLTGRTVDRARPVDAFQQTEGAAACLVSLRAGGTGINLHSADYVFLLDPWWNPAVEAQAIDRVHRIGQRRRVFVYRLVASGTVEDRIERLKQEKRALFGQVLDNLDDPGDLWRHLDSLQGFLAYDAGEQEIACSADAGPTSSPA